MAHGGRMLHLPFHPADWGASQKDVSLPSLSGPEWAVKGPSLGKNPLSAPLSLPCRVSTFSLSPWEGIGGPSICISLLLESSALSESLLFPRIATGKKSANSGINFSLQVLFLHLTWD